MRRAACALLALLIAAAIPLAIGEETSMLTDAMYQRATDFDAPDLGRLKRVLQKALRGEDITLGVIGGSITEGSLATQYQYCYAGRLKDWWSQRFSGTLTFKNAGIGATDSYLGVHRVQKHLLRYEPDLVVIEFSVNDWGNDFYRQSYDSLVQMVLSQPNEPAVILLFMTMENGNSAFTQHSAVGKKYRLPMLSYKNAVLPEIKAGAFTWEDISPDDIHPNDAGHKIVCDIITRYLEGVIANIDSIPDEPAPFVPESPKYSEPRILNSGSLTADVRDKYLITNFSTRFPGNWQGGQEGSRLVFTLEECKNIGVLFWRYASQPGGSVDVYVDGVKTATLNADFTGGWGDYMYAQEVYSSPTAAPHSIELLPTDGKAGPFVVLGIMLSK